MTDDQIMAIHSELARQNVKNWLYAPLPPEIQRVVKPGISVHPDEIKKSEMGYVLKNKVSTSKFVLITTLSVL